MASSRVTARELFVENTILDNFSVITFLEKVDGFRHLCPIFYSAYRVEHHLAPRRLPCGNAERGQWQILP